MKGWMVVCLVVQICLGSIVEARPALTGTAVRHVGDIGEHYPLFLVEKSYHPENVTVVYTKLDAHCHVLLDPTHGFEPTLDFYWLMDAAHYKPMAARLKAAVRHRFQVMHVPWPHGDATAFAVWTDALASVQHDLPQPTVQIKATRHGDACMATASLTLGAADGQATIKLESVSTTTEALTVWQAMAALLDPHAIRIEAVTLQGIDVVTGTPIKRTYRAAP